MSEDQKQPIKKQTKLHMNPEFEKEYIKAREENPEMEIQDALALAVERFLKKGKE
jgi:hypothetical protein